MTRDWRPLTGGEHTWDEQMIASLTDDHATRPASIQPGESVMTRLVVLVTAPAWLLALAGLMLRRLVMGHRPLLVVHERVGFARAQLWVPKIATAAVASNQRRWGGLVEVATGPPMDLEVRASHDQWLRETGLDELPQLVLILLGKMRIVGPRPVTPSEVDEMLQARSEVGIDYLNPGLIGLWQVLDRHGYPLPERCELDLRMIDNWSPRLRRRLILVALRQAARRLRPT